MILIIVVLEHFKLFAGTDILVDINIFASFYFSQLISNCKRFIFSFVFLVFLISSYAAFDTHNAFLDIAERTLWSFFAWKKQNLN